MMYLLRRRFYLLFVSIILFSSISASGISGISPHENFEEADEDLYSIVAFLADTRLLCEESLEYSLRVNCTINFDQTLEMSYSQENLGLSREKSEELEDKLSYSSDILDKIKGMAGSYYYLKDFLLPIKDLGFSVSSFVEDHHETLGFLTEIVDFIVEGGNETELLFALADARSAVSRCRKSVQNMEMSLDEVNQSLSTTILREMIPKLYDLLGKYQYYIDSLIGFIPGMEPLLLLYVDKNDVYLGEEVHTYGYFIAGKGFVTNHIIDMHWENDVINNTLTDALGRYDFVIPISLDHNHGTYNLTASTMYNNTIYYSNIVLVTVHKIPTRILFLIPRTHYYLNESIRFSGRLLDYKNRGINANVSLHFAGFNISLRSDDNGSFTYVFNHTLSFGKYSAFVSFNPEQIYEPCKSQIINIYIDTPTVLTIYTSKNRLFVGEEIKLGGRFTSGIDNSPLSDKTVEVFLNNKKIGFVNTNNTGFYNFTYPTENLDEGVYSIYSRFSSEDVEWRSSSSEVVRIFLVTGFLQKISENLAKISENLAVIVVIIVIATVFLLIFLFRKRLPVFLKKEKPSLQPSAYPSTTISSLRPSEKFHFDKGEFIIDTSAKQRGDFKDAIVTRYRSLLRFLSTRGMIFTPSYTHLDIRTKMIKEGFPGNATDNVTKTFEIAMYSPYPMGKRDVTLFNKNMLSIIDNFGE